MVGSAITIYCLDPSLIRYARLLRRIERGGQDLQDLQDFLLLCQIPDEAGRKQSALIYARNSLDRTEVRAAYA